MGFWVKYVYDNYNREPSGILLELPQAPYKYIRSGTLVVVGERRFSGLELWAGLRIRVEGRRA